MHLKPFLRKQCYDVMDKIYARPISKIFLYPVDPIQDNCPNYFDIVKTPMDLGTIKKNLRGNKYKSIEEWKRDMELVWSNSILFHTENSTVGLMAIELQNYFHELTRYLTDSYRSSWKRQLIELNQEFQTCVKEVSKFHVVQNAPKIRQVVKRDQLGPMLEELPPAQVRRHFKFLTKNEIEKLVKDINSLKVESQIQTISDILKEREPNTFDENDDLVDIDINILQPTTLHIIREQIDQFANS